METVGLPSPLSRAHLTDSQRLGWYRGTLVDLLPMVQNLEIPGLVPTPSRDADRLRAIRNAVTNAEQIVQRKVRDHWTIALELVSFDSADTDAAKLHARVCSLCH